MPLSVEKLCCGYGGVEVVHDLSFSFDVGQVLTILGPNGVGKTTLFKTILGFLKPLAGAVIIDGAKTSTLSRKEVARLLAYVPQSQTVSFSYPVEELFSWAELHISVSCSSRG